MTDLLNRIFAWTKPRKAKNPKPPEPPEMGSWEGYFYAINGERVICYTRHTRPEEPYPKKDQPFRVENAYQAKMIWMDGSGFAYVRFSIDTDRETIAETLTLVDEWRYGIRELPIEGRQKSWKQKKAELIAMAEEEERRLQRLEASREMLEEMLAMQEPDAPTEGEIMTPEAIAEFRVYAEQINSRED